MADRTPLNADLNMTPLIDVLLVLLVIFMVTVPLREQELETTVPQATQPRDATLATVSQIVLRYDGSGALSINQQPTTRPDLPQMLRDIYRERHDKTIYILGDPTLKYRAIVEVMDIARGVGVQRVGIITAGMQRG